MRAGRLRERVQLQSKVEAQNGFGESIATWSTYATVWARVRVARGREFLSANSQQAETTAQIAIRERSDVTEEHQVVWAGREWNIRSVSPPEKPGGEMVLMVTAVR